MTEQRLDSAFTIDDVEFALGEQSTEFVRAMSIIQDMVDNPNQFVGSEAIIQAARLSAIRTQIGAIAQLYKTAEKSMNTRRRKDILLTMYNALEENINTLKLLGRIETKMTGSF